ETHICCGEIFYMNPSNSRNTGVYMYKCACIHMLTRIHTHAYAHTHTHTHTHVLTYSHIVNHTGITHTHMHSHIAMRAHREKESVSEVYSNYTQLSVRWS